MFKGYMKIMGYVVLTLFILGIAFGVTRYFGVWGERKIFEQSDQRVQGERYGCNLFMSELVGAESAFNDYSLNLSDERKQELRSVIARSKHQLRSQFQLTDQQMENRSCEK